MVAQGALWRILTVLAAVNGFSLLTLSVSYLIPVTGAVTERRRLGTTLHGMGAHVQEVLDRIWDGQDLSALGVHLQDLAPELATTAQSYLSYPVVHTFHDPTRATAVEPGVATLHEVVVLLRHVPPEGRGVDPLTLQIVERAFDRLVDVLEGHVVAGRGEPPPVPVRLLEERGIPTAVPQLPASRTAHRRAVLAGWVDDGRWSWWGDVVAGGAGSSSSRGGSR